MALISASRSSYSSSNPVPNMEITCCFPENAAPSQVDSSVILSTHSWAFSILIVKGSPLAGLRSTERVTNIFSHHTVMIIEGFINANEVKNSQEGFVRFWRKAHLRGPSIIGDLKLLRDCFMGHSNVGRVEITKPKYGTFKLTHFKPYRETWPFPSEKIKAVITQIEYDQAHPEQTPFRLLGENSLFAKKITLYITDNDELKNLQKNHPKTFEKIYSIFLFMKGGDTLKYVLPLKYPSYLAKIAKVTSSFNILHLPAIDAMLKTIFFITCPIFCRNFKYIRFVNYSQFFKTMLICYNNFFEGEPVLPLHETVNLLALMIDDIKIGSFVSQNCFNYCRNKLKILDPKAAEELGTKSLEILAVVPSLYLPAHSNDICSRESHLPTK